MLRPLAIAALFVALPGCGAPKVGVEVKDAWSPLAPPGANVLAVYATVVAHDSDALVGVTTPSAREAQLHESREENGMMTMRPVERVPLEAGQTLSLEPGGVHLMLIDPDPSRRTSDPIPLSFHFARAGDVEVLAQVKEAN